VRNGKQTIEKKAYLISWVLCYELRRTDYSAKHSTKQFSLKFCMFTVACSSINTCLCFLIMTKGRNPAPNFKLWRIIQPHTFTHKRSETNLSCVGFNKHTRAKPPRLSSGLSSSFVTYDKVIAILVTEGYWIIIKHNWNPSGPGNVNPLPLLFKSLLPGQEDCVFSSRHLNLHAKPLTGIPTGKKKKKLN
jgi:hypothetical protein